MNLHHLFESPAKPETVHLPCPHCEAQLTLDPVARICEASGLENLFAGDLNTALCEGCWGIVQFDHPLLIAGDFAAIRPLLFVPLQTLEDPQNLDYLSALGKEARVCHSMEELVRMVSVELLLVRHRQGKSE